MGYRLLLVLILLVMLINYVCDLVSVRACVCVNLRVAGVDILLLALRGKTAHGWWLRFKEPPYAHPHIRFTVSSYGSRVSINQYSRPWESPTALHGTDMTLIKL